jgi:hypothetical protein
MAQETLDLLVKYRTEKQEYDGVKLSLAVVEGELQLLHGNNKKVVGELYLVSLNTAIVENQDAILQKMQELVDAKFQQVKSEASDYVTELYNIVKDPQPE